MKTVVNNTHRPLKIHLPQGKVLHLGPNQEGKIQDQAVEAPGIQRLLEAKEIEIRDDRTAPPSAAAGEGGGHEQTQGHVPKAVHKSGDR